MLELLNESLKAPNLPATFLLAFVLVFWLISLIGLIDLDINADVDVEVDGGGSAGGFFNSLLEFFSVGELPITIIVSFFALFFWMGSILTNHYLHDSSSILLGLILLIPNILLGGLLTKIVTRPILKVYRSLNAGEGELVLDHSGSLVTITASATEDHMGQGEINRNGDSIKVYLKAIKGTELRKGSTALLIEQNSDKGIYIAAPYAESIDVSA